MKIKMVFFSLCMFLTTISFAGNFVTGDIQKVNKNYQIQQLMPLTLQTSCGAQVSFDYTCNGCNIY